MLIHVKKTDLLLAHKWQVIKEIKDPDKGNTQKYWLCPFPGFDTTSFPFIALSGMKTFNIVNVKTGAMQILINTRASYYYA